MFPGSETKSLVKFTPLKIESNPFDFLETFFLLTKIFIILGGFLFYIN